MTGRDFWGQPLGDRFELDGTLRPAVKQRTPWIFAVAVLLVAVVAVTSWGLFVSRRIGITADQWHKGVAWVDPNSGVSFRPIRVEESDRAGFNGDQVAPTGSVYLLWEVEVSGVAEASQRQAFVICTFTLVGEGQESWTTASRALTSDQVGSCSDPSMEQGSGVLSMVFLVPKDRLTTLRGIQLDHAMSLDQPPILPRP